MKLVLEIELGNEKMQTLEDVNVAVSRSFAKFAMSNDGFFTNLLKEDGATVVDLNGNLVGTWVVA